MNRRRLDLETMRDEILSAAGALDQRIGGPSFPSLVDTSTPRRSLYGSIDRLNLPGLFRTFDFPDPTTSSPKRSETTVAPQALFLMNHPFTAEMARLTLNQARPESLDFEKRLDELFQRLFQRPPLASERDLARQFLSAENNTELGWQRLAHALMLTNEFVFVD